MYKDKDVKNVKNFFCQCVKVITKLPNSEQSYKGKVKTHNYITMQLWSVHIVTVLLKENDSFSKWVGPKVDKVFISVFYIVETF
jgi:hypothetical protein